MKKSNSEKNKKKLEESDKSELKFWKAPKLVIEDTENTKGGNFNTNSPGDDAWYSS
jgi:hypothetical protein